MCFFTLHRYRSCKHDQVGPFVAFCTAARAQALSNQHSAQSSPQLEHGVYESFLDPVTGNSNPFEPSYCGQPLFSPEYINDFGPDSVNGGICQNCIEMERLVAQGNFKRELQYPKETSKENGLTKLEENAFDEIGQLKSNQFFQHTEQQCHQQTSFNTPSNTSFQLHPTSSCFGNHIIPSPLQPSFHHPLLRDQRLAQRAIHVPRQQTLSEIQFRSYQTTPETAGKQNLEDSMSSSAILQQILQVYPPRTREAIEKAIANQTPEQRAKTHQTLRTYFEEKLQQQEMARGTKDNTNQQSLY